MVNMPYDLVKAEVARSGEAMSPSLIRSVCMKAIRSSDYVVVDLERYGLDTSWEIGYADAIRVQVIGLSQDGRGTATPEVFNRRPYQDNFMHGWDENLVVQSLDDIMKLVTGKSVHVCGSFRNEAAMQKLRESRLGSVVRKLVLPKDVIDLQAALPSDYPWRAREEAIRIQDDADIALVILPRYGMDTSWQIGYAAGRDQQIIGWLSNDYGLHIEQALIWDHWMHGWKARQTMTEMKALAAFLLGQHLIEPCHPDLRVLPGGQ
jgi:nucleoside 2-deoxyribosyltransferase